MSKIRGAGPKKIMATVLVALIVVVGIAYYYTTTLVTEEKMTVVWGTGIGPNTLDPIIAGFNKRYPNIKMNTYFLAEGELAARYNLEILARGRIVSTDIVGFSDKTVIDDWKNKGVLEKYVPKDADKLVPEAVDPDGYWFSSSFEVDGLLYNTGAVSAATVPKNNRDLLDPKWKGRIGMSNPKTSGGANIVIAYMVQNYGWSFWEDFAKNKPIIASTGRLLNTMVCLGEVEAAIGSGMSEYYAQVKQGKPIGYFLPQDGAMYNPKYTSLVKGTENMKASKIFLDWLYSEEAANIYAQAGLYHTRVGAPSPSGFPPISQIKFLKFSWETYTKDREAARDRFCKLVGV